MAVQDRQISHTPSRRNSTFRSSRPKFLQNSLPPRTYDARVHQSSHPNRHPVRGNIPYRKVPPQHQNPRQRQTKHIHLRRAIQLEKLHRRRNHPGNDQHPPRLPPGKQHRKHPINRQCPHRRSAILHNQCRQPSGANRSRSPAPIVAITNVPYTATRAMRTALLGSLE